MVPACLMRCILLSNAQYVDIMFVRVALIVSRMSHAQVIA